MPLVNRFCIAVVIGCTFATLTLSQFSSLKAAFGQEANNQASQPFFVEGTKPLTVFDAEARLGASLELTAGESRIRIYDLATGKQKQNVVIKGASERLLAIAPRCHFLLHFDQARIGSLELRRRTEKTCGCESCCQQRECQF